MTKKLVLAAALLASVPAYAGEPEKQAEEEEPAPPAPAESVPPAEEEGEAGSIGQSPFRVRTSRPNYADSEVARPLTLQKEWAEFGLTYRFREVTQVTDVDGEAQDASYTYTHSWVTLDARYGFTRNLTMYMSIPFSVFTTTEDPVEDETIVSNGMGDVSFGFLWQVLNREKGSSLSSFAVQLDTKQPSGNESPGAPGNRALPKGTGTTNVGIHLHAKQRFGPVAAVVRAGYVHKFSGITMWVRDVEGPLGLNGRFKPGDEISAAGRLIVQPIRFVALEGGAEYISRGPSAIGPTSDGVSPGDDVETIEDSDFEALNATVRLLVEPSVNWDFIVGASIPVMSRNSGVFYPLEDLSQSYGTTILGSAIFRW